MKRYEPAAPRAAIAFAAVALTALTLAFSVIAPTRVHVNEWSTANAIADAPTRVERIDVVAIRPSNIASTQVPVARHKQQQS